MIKLDGSDSQFAIDYELPPLASMKLSVTPARDRGIGTMKLQGKNILEHGKEHAMAALA